MFVPLTQHKAVARAGITLFFECASCGWSGDAASTGVGVGAVTGGGLHLAGGDEEALDAAIGNARAEARDLIRLAPCPACGARRPGAAVQVLAPRIALVVAVFLVVSIGLGGLLYAMGGPWLAALGLVAGVVSPYVWAASLFRLLKTKNAVVFAATEGEK